MMKKWIYFSVLIIAVLTSCTKKKTDYRAIIGTITKETEFKKAVDIPLEDYHILIEALNGAFYKGYNEIHLKITDDTGEVNPASVKLLPVLTYEHGDYATCPHQFSLTYQPDGGYYSGYIVWTETSGAGRYWELYISFNIEERTYITQQKIEVQQQANKNLGMTVFTGEDEATYIIALVHPQVPKIGENDLTAGIYKFTGQGSISPDDFPDRDLSSYTCADGYTLKLDPRMPEPAMGNHSSPNNIDLTQGPDERYHGVVNYTMTGDWTLNFIMLNREGQVIAGTEVPPGFTPGVKGAKSELFIDILF